MERQQIKKEKRDIFSIWKHLFRGNFSPTTFPWKGEKKHWISKQAVAQLPNFLQTIITSAFKISKHMEIIKLLGNFNKKSSIYESFLKEMFATCPNLIDETKKSVITAIAPHVEVLIIKLFVYLLCLGICD